jgi:hypothetical protein
MQHILNKKIIDNKMGKIVLNETQYNRLKNILIENAINEENAYAEAAKETIADNKFFINPRTVTAPGTNGGFKLKFFKGVKFVEGNDPYLKTEKKATIQFAGATNNVGSTTKANIFYNCKTGKLFVKDIENPDLSELHGFEKTKKTFYINDEKITKESFKIVCQNIKKVKTKDVEKINQGGGGEGDKKTYEQAYEQKLKYDTPQEVRGYDGYKMPFTDLTIPKGTIYTSLPEKNGVSFNIKTKDKTLFGWFGCKSKKFSVNKIPLTDEKKALTKKLVSELCKVVDSNKDEIITPDPAIYKGSGGFENYDTSEFDLYI